MPNAAPTQNFRPPERSFWHDTYAPATFWSFSLQPRRVYAGWKYSLILTSTVIVTIATAWGLWTHLAATERITAVILGLAVANRMLAAISWREGWKHDREVVRPLAHRTAGVIDQAVGDRRAWLTVPRDYNKNDEAQITVKVPQGFTAHERDMEDITRAVTVSTGWVAPKPELVLQSRHPRLVYSQNRPPPLEVGLPDILPYIQAAKASQIILGLETPSDPADLDLDSETPMVGLSITTGGGKSEIAKNMAAQTLYHGGIVMILDYKLVSHMWADQLPNVSYARTPKEIQQALMWLAWDEYDEDGNIIKPSELTRRKQVVLAARRRGEHANPGPRLLVVVEERNATGRVVKRFHKRTGGRGASPALESLDETGETGRQIKVNKVDIAQRLSAKASGSDGTADARENIGAIITKDPKEATWKMLADGHTQPPRSGHKGRYQYITASGVSEFQGVLYSKDPDESDRIARELAMSGEIGQVPHDMPFVWRGPLLVPAAIGQDDPARQEGSEQGFVIGRDDPVLTAGDGPGAAVTLAEAVGAGLIVSIGAARKLPKRHGWVPVVEDDVNGHQYALSDIHAYLKTRGKR